MKSENYNILCNIEQDIDDLVCESMILDKLIIKRLYDFLKNNIENDMEISFLSSYIKIKYNDFNYYIFMKTTSFTKGIFLTNLDCEEEFGIYLNLTTLKSETEIFDLIRKYELVFQLHYYIFIKSNFNTNRLDDSINKLLNLFLFNKDCSILEIKVQNDNKIVFIGKIKNNKYEIKITSDIITIKDIDRNIEATFKYISNYDFIKLYNEGL